MPTAAMVEGSGKVKTSLATAVLMLFQENEFFKDCIAVFK